MRLQRRQMEFKFCQISAYTILVEHQQTLYVDNQNRDILLLHTPSLKSRIGILIRTTVRISFEKCCELRENTTGIEAPDSPEAMPGSALHRLGRERRSKATAERGPRLRDRFWSIFTNVQFKFDDAGFCRAHRGAAYPSIKQPFRSKRACPPPVF